MRILLNSRKNFNSRGFQLPLFDGFIIFWMHSTRFIYFKSVLHAYVIHKFYNYCSSKTNARYILSLKLTIIRLDFFLMFHSTGKAGMSHFSQFI